MKRGDYSHLVGNVTLPPVTPRGGRVTGRSRSPSPMFHRNARGELPPVETIQRKLSPLFNEDDKKQQHRKTSYKMRSSPRGSNASSATGQEDDETFLPSLSGGRHSVTPDGRPGSGGFLPPLSPFRPQEEDETFRPGSPNEKRPKSGKNKHKKSSKPPSGKKHHEGEFPKERPRSARYSVHSDSTSSSTTPSPRLTKELKSPKAVRKLPKLERSPTFEVISPRNEEAKYAKLPEIEKGFSVDRDENDVDLTLEKNSGTFVLEIKKDKKAAKEDKIKRNISVDSDKNIDVNLDKDEGTLKLEIQKDNKKNKINQKNKDFTVEKNKGSVTLEIEKENEKGDRLPFKDHKKNSDVTFERQNGSVTVEIEKEIEKDSGLSFSDIDKNIDVERDNEKYKELSFNNNETNIGAAVEKNDGTLTLEIEKDNEKDKDSGLSFNNIKRNIDVTAEKDDGSVTLEIEKESEKDKDSGLSFNNIKRNIDVTAEKDDGSVTLEIEKENKKDKDSGLSFDNIKRNIDVTAEKDDGSVTLGIDKENETDKDSPLSFNNIMKNIDVTGEKDDGSVTLEIEKESEKDKDSGLSFNNIKRNIDVTTEKDDGSLTLEIEKENEKDSGLSLNNIKRNIDVTAEKVDGSVTLDIEKENKKDKDSGLSFDNIKRNIDVTAEKDDGLVTLEIEKEKEKDKDSGLSLNNNKRNIEVTAEKDDGSLTLEIEKENEKDSGLSLNNIKRNIDVTAEKDDGSLTLEIEKEDSGLSLNNSKRTIDVTAEKDDRSVTLEIEKENEKDKDSGLSFNNIKKNIDVTGEKDDRSVTLEIEKENQKDKDSGLSFNNIKKNIDVTAEKDDGSVILEIEKENEKDKDSGLSFNNIMKNIDVTAEKDNKSVTLEKEKDSELSFNELANNFDVAVKRNKDSVDLEIDNAKEKDQDNGLLYNDKAKHIDVTVEKQDKNMTTKDKIERKFSVEDIQESKKKANIKKDNEAYSLETEKNTKRITEHRIEKDLNNINIEKSHDIDLNLEHNSSVFTIERKNQKNITADPSERNLLMNEDVKENHLDISFHSNKEGLNLEIEQVEDISNEDDLLSRSINKYQSKNELEVVVNNMVNAGMEFSQEERSDESGINIMEAEERNTIKDKADDVVEESSIFSKVTGIERSNSTDLSDITENDGPYFDIQLEDITDKINDELTPEHNKTEFSMNQNSESDTNLKEYDLSLKTKSSNLSISDIEDVLDVNPLANEHIQVSTLKNKSQIIEIKDNDNLSISSLDDVDLHDFMKPCSRQSFTDSLPSEQDNFNGNTFNTDNHEAKELFQDDSQDLHKSVALNHESNKSGHNTSVTVTVNVEKTASAKLDEDIFETESIQGNVCEDFFDNNSTNSNSSNVRSGYAENSEAKSTILKDVEINSSNASFGKSVKDIESVILDKSFRKSLTNNDLGENTHTDNLNVNTDCQKIETSIIHIGGKSPDQNTQKKLSCGSQTKLDTDNHDNKQTPEKTDVSIQLGIAEYATASTTSATQTSDHEDSPRPKLSKNHGHKLGSNSDRYLEVNKYSVTTNESGPTGNKIELQSKTENYSENTKRPSSAISVRDITDKPELILAKCHQVSVTQVNVESNVVAVTEPYIRKRRKVTPVQQKNWNIEETKLEQQQQALQKSAAPQQCKDKQGVVNNRKARRIAWVSEHIVFERIIAEAPFETPRNTPTPILQNNAEQLENHKDEWEDESEPDNQSTDLIGQVQNTQSMYQSQNYQHKIILDTDVIEESDQVVIESLQDPIEPVQQTQSSYQSQSYGHMNNEELETNMIENTDDEEQNEEEDSKEPIIVHVSDDDDNESEIQESEKCELTTFTNTISTQKDSTYSNTVVQCSENLILINYIGYLEDQWASEDFVDVIAKILVDIALTRVLNEATEEQVPFGFEDDIARESSNGVSASKPYKSDDENQNTASKTSLVSDLQEDINESSETQTHEQLTLQTLGDDDADDSIVYSKETAIYQVSKGYIQSEQEVNEDILEDIQKVRDCDENDNAARSKKDEDSCQQQYLNDEQNEDITASEIKKYEHIKGVLVKQNDENDGDTKNLIYSREMSQYKVDTNYVEDQWAEEDFIDVIAKILVDIALMRVLNNNQEEETNDTIKTENVEMQAASYTTATIPDDEGDDVLHSTESKYYENIDCDLMHEINNSEHIHATSFANISLPGSEADDGINVVHGSESKYFENNECKLLQEEEMNQSVLETENQSLTVSSDLEAVEDDVIYSTESKYFENIDCKLEDEEEIFNFDDFAHSAKDNDEQKQKRDKSSDKVGNEEEDDELIYSKEQHIYRVNKGYLSEEWAEEDFIDVVAKTLVDIALTRVLNEEKEYDHTSQKEILCDATEVQNNNALMPVTTSVDSHEEEQTTELSTTATHVSDSQLISQDPGEARENKYIENIFAHTLDESNADAAEETDMIYVREIYSVTMDRSNVQDQWAEEDFIDVVAKMLVDIALTRVLNSEVELHDNKIEQQTYASNHMIPEVEDKEEESAAFGPELTCSSEGEEDESKDKASISECHQTNPHDEIINATETKVNEQIQAYLIKEGFQDEENVIYSFETKQGFVDEGYIEDQWAVENFIDVVAKELVDIALTRVLNGDLVADDQITKHENENMLTSYSADKVEAVVLSSYGNNLEEQESQEILQCTNNTYVNADDDNDVDDDMEDVRVIHASETVFCEESNAHAYIDVGDTDDDDDDVEDNERIAHASDTAFCEEITARCLSKEEALNPPLKSDNLAYCKEVKQYTTDMNFVEDQWAEEDFVDVLAKILVDIALMRVLNENVQEENPELVPPHLLNTMDDLISQVEEGYQGNNDKCEKKAKAQLVNIQPYQVTETHGDDKPDANYEFGLAIRNDQFFLEDGVVFLNHGSFGAVPKDIVFEHQMLMEEHETNPDVFERVTCQRYLDESIDSLAEFVGADGRDLSFVESTIRGMKRIFAAVEIESGDEIVINNWTVKGIRRVVNTVCKIFAGVHCTTLVHDVPITDAKEIVDQYRSVLQTHKRVRMIIVDHISSAPSVEFPIRELVELCKTYNVLCVVNGAHTPGHIPLNMKQLNADFYVGNLSKWAFAPTGCAFIWTHPIHRAHMTEIKHLFRGDRETSKNQFIMAKSSLDFIERLGGLPVMTAYNCKLLDDASDMLAQGWNTNILDVPKYMEAPFMRCVLLPAFTYVPRTPEGANTVFKALWNKYEIWAPVFCTGRKLYVRISAQVYCVPSDYERLMDAVLTLVEMQEAELLKSNVAQKHKLGVRQDDGVSMMSVALTQ